LHGIDVLRGVENFHHRGTRHLLDLTPARPDIVHCHNLHGGYFDLRRLPWLSRRVPVILNLRDTWALAGHCAGFQGCERWKTGCGSCPDLGIYPPLKRDTTAANWSRKRSIYANSRLYVTAASQWMMDQIAQSMLQGAKSKLIANGIDLATFRPGDRNHARRALDLPVDGTIVLISAHSSFKPPEPMLDVVRSLKLPGVRLTVVCLAKTQQPESWSHAMAIYRPRQFDPAAMALYYQAADAYLQIAKAEAFGKAIVEAMACGTPVVANAVAAVPDLIRNRETGMLVPSDDPSLLAEALALVLTDRDLRLRIGAQGSEEARRRFSLDRQVAEFLDWYEEVIEDWTSWKRARQPWE
jgi:glycosyltransferase involved in cell wall biosynthesis